jgi:hypothetical protein
MPVKPQDPAATPDGPGRVRVVRASSRTPWRSIIASWTPLSAETTHLEPAHFDAKCVAIAWVGLGEIEADSVEPGARQATRPRGPRREHLPPEAIKALAILKPRSPDAPASATIGLTTFTVPGRRRRSRHSALVSAAVVFGGDVTLRVGELRLQHRGEFRDDRVPQRVSVAILSRVDGHFPPSLRPALGRCPPLVDRVDVPVTLSAP